MLNDRLKLFPSESSNKPNAILNKGKKLGGHAAQNRWLLRFLPILVNDRIEDADNAVWQLVLLLRELVEFVCAPSLSETQIVYMKLLTEEYVEMRQEVFLHSNLRPKHHYLLHYADLSLQFGPLIQNWTMCFESKHSYFKDVSGQVKTSEMSLSHPLIDISCFRFIRVRAVFSAPRCQTPLAFIQSSMMVV